MPQGKECDSQLVRCILRGLQLNFSDLHNYDGDQRGNGTGLRESNGCAVRYMFDPDVEKGSGLHSDLAFDLVCHEKSAFQSLLNQRWYAPLDLVNSFFSSFMYELQSPGKSGAFLYYSSDRRFLVKTVTNEEFKFFIHCVRDYIFHYETHPDSLLNRFMGLFTIVIHPEDSLSHNASLSESVRHKINNMSNKLALINWKTFKMDELLSKAEIQHFVVMENILPPHIEMNDVYDLKGSTLGRTTHDDQAPILKDLDLKQGLRMNDIDAKMFMSTLRDDAEFLCRLNVMDYSLLLGIANVDSNEKGDDSLYCTCCGGSSDVVAVQSDACKHCGLCICYYCLSSKTSLCHLCTSQQCPLLGKFEKKKDGMNHFQQQQQHHHQQQRQGYYLSERCWVARAANGDDLGQRYYCGVIDFLQPFNMRKKLEQKVKGTLHDPLAVSVLEPVAYAKRMVSFVESIIITI